MIRKTISKYGLAFHLALLAALPSALTPFVGADALAAAMLWLSALALVWLFAEPSIRLGERYFDARQRVRQGILRDPFFYFLVLAIVFAFVRWLNNGVALAYDAEQSVWYVKDPSATIFPASVEGNGFLPFAVAVEVAVVILGVRHGLGAAARVSCALLASFFASLAGLTGLVECCIGTPSFVSAASVSFKDAPFWGTLFGAWLVLGFGAGAAAEARKWSGARIVFLLSLVGNAGGLVLFAPPLAAAAYLAFALVFVVPCLVYAARAGSGGAFARVLAFVLLGFLVPSLLVAVFVPEAVMQAKTAALDPVQAFPETWRETSAVLSRLAQKLWLRHPWCGAGEGAFGVHVPFLAEKADWEVLPPKVSIAYNGYRLLLAERGIVGCAFFAVGAGFLLFSLALRLAGGVRALRAKEDSRSLFLSVPPFAWAALPVTALFAGEAVVSPVFRLGASFVPCALILALSAAAFPRVEKKDTEDGDAPGGVSLSEKKES